MNPTTYFVKRAAIGLALLLLFAVSIVRADDDELFQLWNECQPVGVLTWISEDSDRVGLSQERLESLVESRLRVARIFDDSEFTSSLYPYLEVGVNVVQVKQVAHVFGIQIGLVSLVYKEITDTDGWAMTWQGKSVAGVAGRNYDGGSYILQWVGESVDNFIALYLRVNSEACE